MFLVFAKTATRDQSVSKAGASPGVVEDVESNLSEIRKVTFSEAGVQVTQLSEELVLGLQQSDFESRVWIDFCGSPSTKILKHLQSLFGWSDLAVEDVQNQKVRSKLEDYGDHDFLVYRVPANLDSASLGDSLFGFVNNQVLVTFRNQERVVLDPVFRRLVAKNTKLHTRPMTHFAYVLLDLFIDHYFPLMEHLEENINEIEEEFLLEAEKMSFVELHVLRKKAVKVAFGLRQMRAVCAVMSSEKTQRYEAETRLHVRDCVDHIEQLTDSASAVQNTCTFLVDLSVSTANQKTNEVVHFLTLVSAIFVPLSFVAGFYGMNFDTSVAGNMPELQVPFAYVGVIVGMLIFSVIAIGWFKRKKWL